jgi:hypothetical protein
MGGRLPPESVADILRNRWPESIGISGRLRPEWAAGIERNMQFIELIGIKRQEDRISEILESWKAWRQEGGEAWTARRWEGEKMRRSEVEKVGDREAGKLRR